MSKYVTLLTLLLSTAACSPGIPLRTVATASSSGITAVALEDGNARARGIDLSRLEVHWAAGKAVVEMTLMAELGTEIDADILWRDAEGAPAGRKERFVQHIQFGPSPRTALLWESPTPQAVNAEIVISSSSKSVLDRNALP
jgi:hypothetical protein